MFADGEMPGVTAWRCFQHGSTEYACFRVSPARLPFRQAAGGGRWSFLPEAWRCQCSLFRTPRRRQVIVLSINKDFAAATMFPLRKKVQLRMDLRVFTY